MEKQTFTIPDGCKAITMEQVGNQIVTTFELEPIRRRAEFGKGYYSFYWGVGMVASTECGCNTDNIRYNSGNYFCTKEQAERAKQYLQKALDDFWKEELK